MVSTIIKQLFFVTHLDGGFRIKLPSRHLPAQSQQQKNAKPKCEIYPKKRHWARTSLRCIAIPQNTPPLASMSQLPTPNK